MVRVESHVELHISPVNEIDNTTLENIHFDMIRIHGATL